MNARTRRVGLLCVFLASMMAFAGWAQPAVKGLIVNPPGNTSLEVSVWVDEASYAVGETLLVHYSTNQAAYIYIWDITPAGDVEPIFPSSQYAGGMDNYVEAGTHDVPVTFTVAEPIGTEYLQILATTTPIDPFAYVTGTPEEFQQNVEVTVLGLIPVEQRSWAYSSFEIVCAANQGTITATSTPDGATVTVDGSVVGITPTMFCMSSGFHRITFSKSGYQNAEYLVWILGNRSRTITATLTPLASANAAPIADFSYSPSAPAVGEWIQFDASSSADSDGNIVSYAWNFGDGSSGSGPYIWHRFSAAGTYTIALTVTDDDGSTASYSETLMMGSVNNAPTALFTYDPANPLAGEWINLDASASVDVDGSIISYAWMFSDGTSDSGSSVWHRFTLSGTYSATVTVTDDDGATSTMTQSIVVGATNASPTASFTYDPMNPIAGSWVNFDASSSTDSDGTVVSYAWTFGDGTSDSGTSVWHRFTQNGTFLVTLTVTDDDGASSSISQSVTVSSTNVAPQAAFSYSPIAPAIGEWIRFDGTASSDSDGVISAYTWTFSDGTSPATGSSTVYHQFAAAGSYLVTLTVTDDDGATDSTYQTVVIGTPTQAPIASFTYFPASPIVGETVTLNAQGSYDPDGTIVSYRWDLNGDGVVDATTSSPLGTVTYQNAGVVTVTLTVVDDDGLTGSTSLPIVVSTSGGGSTSGEPAMGTTAGIYVWGTTEWHITVNASAGWASARAYRIELRTDGTFQNVGQEASSTVTPLGLVPSPIDGGKTLIFEGSIQQGSVDYTFTIPDSESMWLRLQLDTDGDGSLNTSPSIAKLRSLMVSPMANPFVVGLPDGSTAELLPSINFRVGSAVWYNENSQFVIFSGITIADLEGM